MTDDRKIVEGVLVRIMDYVRTVVVSSPSYRVNADREYVTGMMGFLVMATDGLVSERKFLRDAKWSFSKPRALKQRGTIQARGMWVRAGGTLQDGDVSASFDDISQVRFRESIPYCLQKHFLSIPDHDFSTFRESLHGHVRAAVQEAVSLENESSLARIDEEFASYWDECVRGADALVEKHLAARGSSIRSTFRKKMSRALRECEDLLDEDPDLVLRVMKLSPGDLKALSKFAERNEQDLDLIDVEDVRACLDELKVSRTLGS